MSFPDIGEGTMSIPLFLFSFIYALNIQIHISADAGGAAVWQLRFPII
jgi:hypothetical protein